MRGSFATNPSAAAAAPTNAEIAGIIPGAPDVCAYATSCGAVYTTPYNNTAADKITDRSFIS
ncbi:hypothetical protein C0Z19_02020 [Trinickia soli]|uniref:Uncharacterized protein n=1 Tax=Trinickia soli TaxID=380675 RepID=A0A2N7WGF1_9BURK|nr:hypothetical protein C0Z19_02020 [Trinickia soli]